MTAGELSYDFYNLFFSWCSNKSEYFERYNLRRFFPLENFSLILKSVTGIEGQTRGETYGCYQQGSFFISSLLLLLCMIGTKTHKGITLVIQKISNGNSNYKIIYYDHISGIIYR